MMPSKKALASVTSLCSRQGRAQPTTKRTRFIHLVNTLAVDIYSYAYALCGSKDLAEELTQETFMRAWKAWPTLRDECAAKSWLLTIVKREHARLYERRRLKPVPMDVDQLEAAVDFDTRTEAVVLRQAMQRLPSEYREPLMLQVIGGYSLDEIAEQLGLSLAAVTTRVFRARQKLRQALGELS